MKSNKYKMAYKRMHDYLHRTVRQSKLEEFLG